ncbi:MAG: isopenicillin N synthase family dioxygenase [Burkholderiaceae bacterium]
MTADFAAARTTGAAEIQVINIAALLEGGDTTEIASAIHDAATRVGFFYLSGHGIPQHLMNQAFAVTEDFFALPKVDKASIAVNTNQRGWMAPGMSKMQGAATHDLKEVFFWGTEVAPDHPDLLADKPLVAENQWPDEAFPRLRADLTPYYLAVCDVGRKVLSAIAAGFGASENFFEPHYEFPLARGQLVYYPPSTVGDEAEKRFGVAPHTDFGVLTLLLQDTSGGLQVRTRDGQWIEAPPIPGTLVCNIGDLLQRWSNDRFRSTVHRVINRSGNARYSIPIFLDPNSDAVVDPRDLGADTPHHLPVVAGKHIAARNRRSFKQYQSP